MAVYAFSILISAFLLFLVQPLIAKPILPWFGGGPAVWTTCMLFFQVVLLAGYVYAHLITTRLAQRTQVLVHVLLLCGALLALPVYPGGWLKPSGPGHPASRILLLLAVTVGLPYFVLSATSPLLQKWFGLVKPAASSYRLYALSNAGSLLALVTYPVMLEPTLGSRRQSAAWSLGFVLFALLCAAAALATWRVRPLPPAAGSRSVPARLPEPPPPLLTRLLWILLPANGSLLLLAVTNEMCQDVAVVPFLWILPLGIYLLSFIICFDSERWYWRPLFWPVMVLAVIAMCRNLFKAEDETIVAQVGVYSIGLFACCMVCHGELVRLKPGTQHLTSFYLMVSMGGALGGVLVAVVAPLVFSTYAELNLGIWTACAAALLAWWHETSLRRREQLLIPFLSCVVPGCVGLVILAVVLHDQSALFRERCVSLSRSFYGVLRVEEEDAADSEMHRYILRHGRIKHGWQFLSAGRRDIGVAYYGEQSGVGVTLRYYQRRSGLRVGIVGLGAGCLAVYGKPGDRYRFYEINPQVAALADSRFFTYLRACTKRVA